MTPIAAQPFSQHNCSWYFYRVFNSSCILAHHCQLNTTTYETLKHHIVILVYPFITPTPTYICMYVWPSKEWPLCSLSVLPLHPSRVGGREGVAPAAYLSPVNPQSAESAVEDGEEGMVCRSHWVTHWRGGVCSLAHRVFLYFRLACVVCFFTCSVSVAAASSRESICRYGHLHHEVNLYANWVRGTIRMVILQHRKHLFSSARS